MHSHLNDLNRTAQFDALFKAPWATPGYLMIIGGADRLDPDALIARLFLGLVDRVTSHTDQRDIIIVSTATRHPEILTTEYVRIFSRLGYEANRLHAPLIRNRDEALDPQNWRLLENAAGIFITGGDQYSLTQVLDRTPCEQAIMQAYDRGAVVAGTSAGATAMGKPMVVAGGGSGELRMGMVQISDGLAWAGENLIIDTHFGSRGRFPRLTAAVAEHPESLGVGIDENTCLLVSSGGHCTVAGSGVVYFVDASHVRQNSAREAHSGQAISVGTLRVDVLSSGDEYNLATRQNLLAIGDTCEV